MKLSELHTNKTKGQVKVICPECKDNRTNGKDKSLSVSLDSGLYKCHYCGTHGILDEYKKVSHFTKEEKEYTLPKLNTTGLGDSQLAYLMSRGITGSTINRNKITQSPKGWIEFNYYELDELVNIKYRSINDKRFMQHKGGKPILYGLNDIIQEDTVIIVEGEIDKLSMEEAGFKNCVSVPLGAPNADDSNADSKLRCFEYAKEYFDSVERIIIAVDNDKNGNRLKEEIARRFGKEVCYVVDFGDCKDANEVLTTHGTEHLKSCVIQAKGFPIDGVVYFADALQDIHDLYVNGLPEAHSVNLGSGFDELYRVKEGYLTIVTGVPTHGKSNFVEQMMVNLINSRGWKFGSYSPEHYPVSMFFQRIARIYTGKSFFKGFMDRMNTKELAGALGKMNDHLYPIYAENSATIDDILDTMAQLVFKHGIKGVIIDPWTDLEHKLQGKSETVYISESLAKIKRFNQKYDVHTWLIVHPKKMGKDDNGNVSVPTLYDCSGSANFYNRADFGMTVYRNQDNTVDVHLQKVKFEGIYGKKGVSTFMYNKASCRYSPVYETEREEVEMF